IKGLAIGDSESLHVREHPIPITVDDKVTVLPGGMIQLIFSGSNWDSTIKFESGIDVSLGGTLDVTFANDVPVVAQEGRSFKAFDWTGVTASGQFQLHVPAGSVWDTSKLYTTGELTMLGTSSDIDGDKDVDSADLLTIFANWTGSDYTVKDKT